MTKSIRLSNLFLPGRHHQDAPGRKRTKLKFHQEHMKKNQTLAKFWQNTKIIGPYPRMYVRRVPPAIIESRLTGCKSLVVEL